MFTRKSFGNVDAFVYLFVFPSNAVHVESPRFMCGIYKQNSQKLRC